MTSPARFLIAAAVAALPAAVPPAARAEAARPEVVDSVADGGVTAEVARLGDLRHRVTVNGAEVLLDEESLGVRLRGVQRAAGHAWVLVERASGGTACPSTFVAVDATASPPAATPEFGNCSDLPEVTAEGDALVVSMPNRNGRVDTYVIRGHAVSERH